MFEKFNDVWERMQLDRFSCVVCGSPKNRRLVGVLRDRKDGIADSPAAYQVVCKGCHSKFAPETPDRYRDVEHRNTIGAALVAWMRVHGRERSVPPAYKRADPYTEVFLDASRLRAKQWAGRLAEVLKSLGYKVPKDPSDPLPQKQRKPMSAEGRANLSAARVKQWAEWRERENQ